METRLCLTEQSNRVLLDEVLRLQSQLHKAVQASQEALAAERKSRDKLETELINIRDSLDNISQRLERVEGTSQLDRNSLIAVVNQARSLEQILTQTNHELRRDQGQQNVQIQEMRAELDEMSATHNRMESIVYNLADDMRNLKGATRLHYKQFRTVSAELNHRTDKIRHENKRTLDRIRACQDKTTQSEVNTANLRIHVGARMAEISDALLGLNEKVEVSIQKQSQFEQRVSDRFDQVQSLMDMQTVRVNGTNTFVKTYHMVETAGSYTHPRRSAKPGRHVNHI